MSTADALQLVALLLALVPMAWHGGQQHESGR